MEGIGFAILIIFWVFYYHGAFDKYFTQSKKVLVNDGTFKEEDIENLKESYIVYLKLAKLSKEDSYKKSDILWLYHYKELLK